MALSRNARRLKSKCRKAREACDMVNTLAVLSRREIVRGNLSHSPSRDNSRGLVSQIYSGAANPMGYTRNKRPSTGAANAGTSGGKPVA